MTSGLIEGAGKRRWRLSRRAVLVLAALGIGGVSVAPILQPGPLLVWNASASAPIGLYLVLPGQRVMRGDMVLAQTPETVRSLAIRRGYLSAGVPLVKQVAALGGDEVCGFWHFVSINGELVGPRLEEDQQGRPLPAWNECRTLRAEELFLLMPEVPNSFDGRYFGPVPVENIIGRLVPLWTD